MENVPEVVGKNNIAHFKKWEERLRQFGYSNYVEILNGKNYGIPQNRKRCFMISILGEYAYDFPCKIPLKYKLKDLLEKEVDEKYYLSEKMIDYIIADNEKWTGNNEKSIVNKNIASTLNTKEGGRRCDASNYELVGKEERELDLKTLLNQDKPKKVGNYGNGHHAKDVYDPNQIAPTITTGNHGLGQTIVEKERKKGILIKNATKQGYLEANIGDGVDISTRMETHRGTVQKDSCQTLTCQGGENVGVVVKKNE